MTAWNGTHISGTNYFDLVWHSFRGEAVKYNERLSRVTKRSEHMGKPYEQCRRTLNKLRVVTGQEAPLVIFINTAVRLHQPLQQPPHSLTVFAFAINQDLKKIQAGTL